MGTSSLHSDSLIHTARGLVPVCELHRDDIVFAVDDATRTVLPTTCDIATGPRDRLVSVRVGTHFLEVGHSQEFLALVDRRRPGRIRRRYRREWRSAGELRPGDIVAVARKTPDLGRVQLIPLPAVVRDGKARAVVFPTRSDEDLMWWLGLYAGDGYVSNHGGGHRRVEFAIPATQPDLRAELVTVTRRLFSVDARGKDEWRVVAPGILLVDFVEAVGLRGKALEKRIPSWVFAAPESQRLAFLGGYVDADGLVRAAPKSKDMGATSANEALLEDARRLAISCGVRTTRVWSFTSRHPVDRDRIMTGYRMQFSGEFDRIGCRAAQRRDRMNKRRFVHNNTSIGGTTVRSHATEWIGFARVRAVSPVGPGSTYVIRVRSGVGLVADTIILRAERGIESTA